MIKCERCFATIKNPYRMCQSCHKEWLDAENRKDEELHKEIDD